MLRITAATVSGPACSSVPTGYCTFSLLLGWLENRSFEGYYDHLGIRSGHLSQHQIPSPAPAISHRALYTREYMSGSLILSKYLGK